MRIVSLLPGATDMVTALGLGARIAGISHSCTAPTGSSPVIVTRSKIRPGTAADVDHAVSATHQAGEPLYGVDDAAIERLAPDLIFTQALCDVCAVSETDVRALAERLPSKPHVEALNGSTIDGIFADLRRVADLLDAPEEAEELEAGLRMRMRAIHNALKAARAPRPTVAVIEWTDPPYAAGHWVPEMIHRAGGRDVLAQPGDHSYPRTIDEIRSADPEFVLIAPCGYELDQAAEETRDLFRRHEWEWLDSRNVWVLDANALTSRPSPSVVTGIETIARILHPAIFPPPVPQQALRMKRPFAS